MSESKPERPEPPKLPDKPAAGPGVTAWLSALLGPQPSALRESFSPSGPGILHLPVALPATLLEGDGQLRRLSARALPDGVALSAGRREADGQWVLMPSQLPGLQAIVQDGDKLPLAVTFKAEFASTDGSGTWTEMMGIIIDRSAPEEHQPDVPPVRIETTATKPLPSIPDVSHVIDLDVSLGIDDPAAYADLVLVFSGFPDKTSLSDGEAGEDGKWRVTVGHLDGLAVMVPDGAQPFDLTVTVDGDPEDEGSSFRIELSDMPMSASLRLGPPMPPVRTRVKIFADGAQVADRMIGWSDKVNDPAEVRFSYGQDKAPPFELVARYTLAGATAESEGPVFLEATIDGDTIDASSHGVLARGSVADGGRRWHGDLVIDVRQARRPEMPRVAMDVEMPPKPVAPSPVIEDTEPVADTPISPEMDAPAEAPIGEEAAPMLVLQAAAHDIRRPGFIQELERLGRFIRQPTNEEDQRHYDRLGIDVGRWQDIAIFGPAGQPVETAPMLPALAPPGGRDNARGFSHLDRWYAAPPGVPAVMVEGLPPGSMLSHGVNLGDGRWRVRAEDIPNVSVVGPIGEQTTVPAFIAEVDEYDQPVHGVGAHAILMGTIADTLRPEAFGMRVISYPLTPDVFDPDGHRTLSLTIGDMPPGSLVVGGNNHGGGVWTLDTESGRELAIVVAGQSAPFKFSVTCIALDKANGNSSVVTRKLSVVPRLGSMDAAA